MTSKIRGNADPAWCSDPDQQVRRLVPAAQQRPAGVVLRSEDEAVHADRHLLRDAPPAVRQRCERDGLLQRAERADRRLDRHEGLRRDEGRAEGGRLVRPGASTPTATARSRGRGTDRRPRRVVLYAGETPRRRRTAWTRCARAAIDPKLDTLVNFSLYGVIPSPVDDSVWGVAERYPGLPRPAASAATIRRRRCMTEVFKVPDARLRSARRRHRHATASSGRRWPPAATWPASTAASART